MSILFSPTYISTYIMNRTLPSDVLNNMKAQLNQGATVSNISKTLGISKGVISKYSNKWNPNRIRNQGGRPGIVRASPAVAIKSDV